MFVLFTQAVYSNIYAGQPFNLTTVKCYGDVHIELGSKVNVTEDEYKFIGCNNYDEDKWACKCNNGNEQIIQLLAKKGTNNIYNVKLSYYIQPKQKVPEYDVKIKLPPKEQVQNDINYRTRTFPNLKVGKAPAKPLPPITTNIWRFFIGGSILIFILITFSIIKLYRYIMKDDIKEEYIPRKQSVQQSKQPISKIPVQMTDDEILNYFRNNAK